MNPTCTHVDYCYPTRSMRVTTGLGFLLCSIFAVGCYDEYKRPIQPAGSAALSSATTDPDLVPVVVKPVAAPAGNCQDAPARPATLPDQPAAAPDQPAASAPDPSARY